jgi:hypothetical protein
MLNDALQKRMAENPCVPQRIMRIAMGMLRGTSEAGWVVVSSHPFPAIHPAHHLDISIAFTLIGAPMILASFILDGFVTGIVFFILPVFLMVSHVMPPVLFSVFRIRIVDAGR